MDRQDLTVLLEQHETDAAGEAARALRAGASFQLWAEASVPASRLLVTWPWRARCMAEDGIVTLMDFEHGLPALRRAAGAAVTLARVGMPGDSRLVFLTVDLSSCVAVL